MSHSVFGSGFRKVAIALSAVIALAIGIGVVPVRAVPSTVYLTVHYYRDNGDFGGQTGGTGGWNMWIWRDAPGAADDVAVNAPAGNPFVKGTSSTKDTWGYAGTLNVTITGFTSAHTQIGFIVRQGLWDNTDIGFDRFVTNIDSLTGKAEIWLKEGDKTVYTSQPRLGPAIKSASVDDFNKVTVLLNRSAASNTGTSNFSLCPMPTPTVTPSPGSPAVDGPAPTSCVAGSGGTPTISSVVANTARTSYTLNLGSDVTLGKSYYVLLKDAANIDFGSQKTFTGKIFTTTKFNDQFFYSGDDLGTTYTQANTKFRLWAPTATDVKVRLYGTVASPRPTPSDVPMTKDVKGTWVATATGDLDGQIYMYRVSVDGRILDAIDPYTRATTINSGQGVVVDLAKTDPAGFATHTKPPFSGKHVDASIYQLHVRDLSMDKTSGYPAAQQGKYTALANFNTTYCGVASPAPTKPAIPAVPTGLKATAGKVTSTPTPTATTSPKPSATPTTKPVVYLQWNHSTTATSYKVYRGATATTATTLLGTTAANGYTDSAVVNNATYFYAVRATNGGGDSAATTAVTIKPVVATATATAMPSPTPSIRPTVAPTPWTCPSAAVIKTGMGHIKEMGATHVQLQPVYDFGSVNETSPTFNWGYDPANQNVPEGSYSTNPANPTTRITELKGAIQAMHGNGLRVILDVIHNHVMNPNTFSFESIVPGYFFRTDANGNLTNASGCGNDVASERPMVRKYIIDSVKYWATQYKVDGFRFDIMSLVDKTTMAQVTTELLKIDPTMVLLGEGWTYDATKAQLSLNDQSRQQNAADLPQVAFFNDEMRDGTKGDTGNDILPGYVNGWADNSVSKVINGLVGQTTAYPTKGGRSWTATSPGQSVNYVEVHDGYTLWDKLNATNTLGVPTSVVQKWDRQAAAITFLSNGMPFIQAGQEFLRSKKGEHNSYSPPQAITTVAGKLAWELDVSSLKWNQAYTNKSIVDYYKGLIKLRKEHPLLRLDNNAAIDGRFKWAPAVTGANTLGFYYDQGNLVGDSWTNIAIGINPNGSDQTLTLPNSGTWYVVVNGTAAGTSTLQTITGNKVTIPANSVVVVRQ